MAQLQTKRDAPGTQREYETIFILRPEASTDNIQDINTRIRKIIEESGGKLLRVDNWGKRKLAYEIRKELKGIYLYWQYLGVADLVAEVERNLRMLDLVIRYYSVRVDQDVHPEARPSQMDDEKFLAAATTIPDEEDTYMGRGLVEDGMEGEPSFRENGDEEKRDDEGRKEGVVAKASEAASDGEEEGEEAKQPQTDAPAGAGTDEKEE